MRKLTYLLLAVTALVASAASIGSGLAAPADGAAIAKAASANQPIQEAYWRGRGYGYGYGYRYGYGGYGVRPWGYARGWCAYHPYRC